MADPTIKDVLVAIARLDAKVDAKVGAVDAKVESLRDEMNDRFDDVDRRFDRVDKQLVELDRDLDGHMKVHAELERDVEALKGRPLRTAARVRRGARKRPSK
jgi:hypothetical protein